MSTTPNTPANAGKALADIAREAADKFLQGPRPTMSQFLTVEDCLKAQCEFLGDIIQQAIERDRAERDAAPKPFRPSCISKADTNETGERFLGQPERWLQNPTWRCENGHVSKRYLKSERLGRDACLECEGVLWLTFPEDIEPNKKQLAEREAELAIRDKLSRQSVQWAAETRAKLAEQSAERLRMLSALDTCKTALDSCEHAIDWKGNSCGPYQFDLEAVSDALAQIAAIASPALAGGKES